ncbi:MAG: pilus assembly protein PilM [Armatimonadetes bacterium]|nr:pilus assembly protein PilM [Armatimonadota bacterium]
MASTKATGPTVGLDIGTAFIKAVEMRPARGKSHVAALGIAPTPPNTFTGDVISDPVTLGTAIKKLLQESGIGARKVVASVSGQTNFVIRILPVPAMTDKELVESMRWEVERHVPFRPEDTIQDYVRLPSFNGNGEGSEMNVLLVVGQKQMIDAYTQTLFFAGLTPAALDVEPLSLLRTIPLGEVREHCLATVNIGASKTDVGIFDKGVLVYPRSIPVAGNNLTRAVADTLGLPTEQAERMKVEYGEIPENRTPATSIFDEPGGAFGAFDLPDEFGAPTATEETDEDLDFGAQFAAPTTPAAPEPDEPIGFEAPLDDEATSGLEAPLDDEATSGGGIAFTLEDEEDKEENAAPGGFSFALDDEEPAASAPPPPPEPRTASPGPTAFSFEDEDDLLTPPATETERTSSFALEPDAPDSPVVEDSPFGDIFGETEAEPAPAATGDAFSDEPLAAAPGDAFSDEPLAAAPVTEAPVPVTEEDRRRRVIADALVPVYNDLALEIRRTIDVYANRPDGRPVERIYLSGGSSRMRGLAHALELDLGIPVQLEDPTRVFSLTGKNAQPGYYAEVGPVMTVAIGLGIRDHVPDPTPAVASGKKRA